MSLRRRSVVSLSTTCPAHTKCNPASSSSSRSTSMLKTQVRVTWICPALLQRTRDDAGLFCAPVDQGPAEACWGFQCEFEFRLLMRFLRHMHRDAQ